MRPSIKINIIFRDFTAVLETNHRKYTETTIHHGTIKRSQIISPPETITHCKVLVLALCRTRPEFTPEPITL